MGISTPGVGSGLDIKTMVDVIVKAEITSKQVRQDRKVTQLNTELSGLGLIKSQLTNFQSVLTKLSDLTSCYTMKYSTTDSSYFNTTVSSEAAPGVYQIKVKQLAQQQSLATGYYTDNSTSLGNGNLTIKLGTYSTDNTTFTQNPDTKPITITLSDGANSLASVCEAINKTQAGVSASIVQDSQGARLALTSTTTGLNCAMQITSDTTALNYDPTTSQNGLTQTMAAQNSAVLINGLEITQSTNQIKEAFTGITLNLKKADENTTVTLTVEHNKDQLSGLLTDFVKQYNESITLLNNATRYDQETKQRGPFQGDTQIRELKFNLNKWTTGKLQDQNGSLQTLSDLGISIDRGGLLQINKEKLQNNLDNNYQQIGLLFAKESTNQSDTSSSNEGMAVLLNQFLDTYTGTKGTLDGRSEQLKQEGKNLAKNQTEINKYSELLEQRYLKKFNALDSLIADLRSKSDSLTQMLGNLPQMNNKR